MSSATQEPAVEAPATNSIGGLEHLMRRTEAPAEDVGSALAQAVTYLRVSTPRQLHTAADIDEDDNSIATQRVEAVRKAEQLKARVVREFFEPGQSAQTINKRPEFKRMLRYLDQHPEVKHVVIYMRSRVFRNFTDAAITKRYLLQRGVRLISAKEEFGEGYMADAMEAITDIMNEVQVRANGEDVKIKLAHELEQGGTVGRARLGYLNVRKEHSGRLVNTIDVDPVRGPLITLAFEQYATGHYSIYQLRYLLEEHGLTTRPWRSRASGPVAISNLATMPRDPYYTGVIRYKGKLHPGRHEALIPKETFLKVHEVLDSQKRLGDRDIVQFHYLKGLLFCGECEDAGRTSRLVYSVNRGNGGEYEYLVCAAKQRRQCTMPWVRVELVESHRLPVVDREAITAEPIAASKSTVTKEIADLLTADRESKARLGSELQKLEAQEERLVQLAVDSEMPIEHIRSRLEKTVMKKGAVKEKLLESGDRLQQGAETAIAYLDLLERPAQLFTGADDRVRRDLLLYWFESLTVWVERDRVHIEAKRHKGNEAVRLLAPPEKSRTPR